MGLVKVLADPCNQLPAMTFWLLGSLAASGAADLAPLLGPVALGTAALLGGGMLLLIDTLARSVAAVVVPLGILTAVVGTPFFLFLLQRQQRAWA